MKKNFKWQIIQEVVWDDRRLALVGLVNEGGHTYPALTFEPIVNESFPQIIVGGNHANHWRIIKTLFRRVEKLQEDLERPGLDPRRDHPIKNLFMALTYLYFKHEGMMDIYTFGITLNTHKI